ncbi:histone H4 transcription factor-like [Latimeria chalumnae]|uniref:histone H4 transcription factor-like n=1 Tax=Latimeria chalumnae TaxID=7897 RepID=UPI00313E9F51
MFSNNTKFLDHFRRQLPEEKQMFQCQHCKKRCATERLLRDHTRAHENHVKCPLCDLVSTTWTSLRTHIKFKHCSDRPFPCDFCDSSFKNSYDLNKHVETHNDETAYRCSAKGCGFTSRTLQTFKHHYKRVHEGDGATWYKCHICERVFSWGYSLTNHLRKKHELKWPSGHSRFRYKEDGDGYWRLNMILCEGLKATERTVKDVAKKQVQKSSSNRPRVAGAAGETKRSSATRSRATDTAKKTKRCSSGDRERLSRQPPEAAEPLPGEVTSVETEASRSKPEYCTLQNALLSSAEPSSSTKERKNKRRKSSGAMKALKQVARDLGIHLVIQKKGSGKKQ